MFVIICMMEKTIKIRFTQPSIYHLMDNTIFLLFDFFYCIDYIEHSLILVSKFLFSFFVYVALQVSCSRAIPNNRLPDPSVFIPPDWSPSKPIPLFPDNSVSTYCYQTGLFSYWPCTYLHNYRMLGYGPLMVPREYEMVFRQSFVPIWTKLRYS